MHETGKTTECTYLTPSHFRLPLSIIEYKRDIEFLAAELCVSLPLYYYSNIVFAGLSSFIHRNLNNNNRHPFLQIFPIVAGGCVSDECVSNYYVVCSVLGRGVFIYGFVMCHNGIDIDVQFRKRDICLAQLPLLTLFLLRACWFEQARAAYALLSLY